MLPRPTRAREPRCLHCPREESIPPVPQAAGRQGAHGPRRVRAAGPAGRAQRTAAPLRRGLGQRAGEPQEHRARPAEEPSSRRRRQRRLSVSVQPLPLPRPLLRASNSIPACCRFRSQCVAARASAGSPATIPRQPTGLSTERVDIRAGARNIFCGAPRRSARARSRDILDKTRALPCSRGTHHAAPRTNSGTAARPSAVASSDPNRWAVAVVAAQA